jgi:transcriptional regulator with XRE-family HTH domain
MNLGQIIKIRRTEDNLSLKQMADFLGVSESMLSRIENGDRKISEDCISKVSKYLKISEREIKVYHLVDDIKSKYSNNNNFQEAIKRINNEYDNNY